MIESMLFHPAEVQWISPFICEYIAKRRVKFYNYSAVFCVSRLLTSKNNASIIKST